MIKEIESGKDIEWTEASIQDLMRGNVEKHVDIRFNPKNIVKLSCSCDYGEGKKKTIILMKEVEFKEDGFWKPYPVVSRPSFSCNGELVEFLVLMVRDGWLYIKSPEEGGVDDKLLSSAMGARLCVVGCAM